VANGRKELRGVAQEAARIGVSKAWLYTEIREGRFPHVRLGGRVLLDPAEVDAFLAARAVGVEEALRQAEEDEGRW
jgi:excisionase family DNA binding protein